jgi:putative transposase
MPNHFHIILKTNTEIFISTCVGNLKRLTSRLISRWLRENGETELLKLLSARAKEEPAKDCKIWKPRFDCFVITNEMTLRQKIEYIHNNPVKKEHAKDAIKWPHSSVHNYAGLVNCPLKVDIDWLCLGYDKLPSGKGS